MKPNAVTGTTTIKMGHKRVLISGAGVAGPTLAYWLLQYGFQPTLVEVAPALRTGGYVIDFWGLGFQVAAKMGLEREILEAGYRVRQLRVVNRDGETEVALNADFLRPWTGEGLTSLPRGELAAVIYRSISGRVETRFGDSI
jgi:2-polyprenyl-6-methoxyphenol hydroxylase-like FAD-dependent oxidoreductase